MKANTLSIFEAFKRTMTEEDARLIVNYIEDANEAEIVKTVERKIEHLATKEDISNLRVEVKDTKADMIKWMFIFWVSQLGALFGLLHFFLKK